MRKFAVWVFDEGVFRAGQAAARAGGVSMSQWVTGAMRAALEGLEAPKPAVFEPAVPPPVRVVEASPAVVAAWCRCGHSSVMHKDEAGRCQHQACYPNGCRAFREPA